MSEQRPSTGEIASHLPSSDHAKGSGGLPTRCTASLTSRVGLAEQTLPHFGDRRLTSIVTFRRA